jgi:predicted amidohydrolase YtcJ
MRKALIASLLFAFVIGEEARAEDPPSRILINGVVLTMDKSDRVAQAIAINGDRIVAVGSNAEIGKLADARTNVVNVGGRTIIPGLIDSHLHAIRGGQTYKFETYWYDVTTLDAALSELTLAAGRKGPGHWVAVAGSWAPEQFAERRAPTVADLNKALPNNPCPYRKPKAAD